ncbi:MAG TPA: protein kinase [Terriglobales bacterium]|nr:protein kinase [Terriglobales bacterium]
MIGTTISHYRVLRRIAGGGMGVVYEAEDLNLGRRVALKFLPENIASSPNGLRRFRREARAASALNHPNVCTIYDIAEADGMTFIAMEFLEGRTLKALMTGQPMRSGFVTSLAVQITGALKAAHAKGILHRDIKPANIFVTEDGQAKLLDFGVAKILNAESERFVVADATVTTELTTQGAPVGTISYMSPEQALGKPLDARTDLFSLGVALYEMSTGVLPFRGDSWVTAMQALLSDVPVRAVHQLNPDVPPQLERIICRALEKNRELRYQTAAEMRTDLRRLENYPSAAAASASTAVASMNGPDQTTDLAAENFEGAPHPRLSGPTTLPGRRWPPTLVLTAILALAVIATISATAVWWFQRARPAHRATSFLTDDSARRVLAVFPFENISPDQSQEYFSAGITEEIRGQLCKLSSLQVLSKTAVAGYKDPRNNLRQVANELGATTVVFGSVRQDSSRIRINVELVDTRSNRIVWAEQYNRELNDILAVQSDVALRIADALVTTLSSSERQRIEKLPTRNVGAYRLYLQSQELSQSDLRQNREAIKLLERAIEIDPQFAVAASRLAYRQFFLALFASARYIDLGMKTARRAVELDPNLSDAHIALSFGYRLKGQVTKERVSLLKATELNPNDSTAMQNLSILETELGRYAEALHWARRAFRLDPHHGVSYYHLCAPLLFLGDDSVTETWLSEGNRRFPGEMRLQILFSMLDILRGREREALDRARKVAQDDPDNEELDNLVADVALITGTPDATTYVEHFFRSVPDLNANWWLLPESYRVRYAYLLANRGETKRAHKLLNEAERKARQTLDEGDETPRLRMELAAIYALREQNRAALEWLERAYDLGWRDARTLARDPMLQRLREEQAFKDLVSRITSEVAAMRERSTDLRELRQLKLTRIVAPGAANN